MPNVVQKNYEEGREKSLHFFKWYLQKVLMIGWPYIVV